MRMWIVIIFGRWTQAVSDCSTFAPERIGDGFCDGVGSRLNIEECGWDGSDCCCDTCTDGEFPCGVFNHYQCKDPESKMMNCADPCINLINFPETIGTGAPNECYRITTFLEDGQKLIVEAIGGTGDVVVALDEEFPLARPNKLITIKQDVGFSRLDNWAVNTGRNITTYIFGKTAMSGISLVYDITDAVPCVSFAECSMAEFCSQHTNYCNGICETCVPQLLYLHGESGADFCPVCQDEFEANCGAQNLAFIGDGYCDREYNTRKCRYDGGDCCPDTSEGRLFPSGINGYSCVDETSDYVREYVDFTNDKKQFWDPSEVYFINSTTNMTVGHNVPAESLMFIVTLKKGSVFLLDVVVNNQGVSDVKVYENYTSRYDAALNQQNFQTLLHTNYEYEASEDINIGIVIFTSLYQYIEYLKDIKVEISISSPRLIESESEKQCDIRLKNGDSFSETMNGVYEHVGFVDELPYYEQNDLYLFFSKHKSRWCVADVVGSNVCLVFSADNTAMTPDLISRSQQWLALTGLPNDKSVDLPYVFSSMFATRSDECLSQPWKLISLSVVGAILLAFLILFLVVRHIERGEKDKTDEKDKVMDDDRESKVDEDQPDVKELVEEENCEPPNKTTIFWAGFGILNFATDLVFVINIFVVDYFLEYYILVVFAVPIFMSLGSLLVIIQSEIKNSPEGKSGAWFSNNFGAVVVLFVSLLSPMAAPFLYSWIISLNVFKGPFEDNTRTRIEEVGVRIEKLRCSSMFIVELVVLILSNYMNVAAVVALVVTALYLLSLIGKSLRRK